MKSISLSGILLCFLCQVEAASPPKKEKFTQVSGTVTSIFCDTNGNSRVGELAPDVPARVSCQFKWFSSDAKWRLDINEPIPPSFRDGVWRSIMPFAEDGLISIASFPTYPDNPKAGGNAIVRVLTNQYVVAENRYGSHVLWMGFPNKTIEDWLVAGRCRPFWKSDSRINQLASDFYQIVRTNGVIIFWNPGKYFNFDDQGKLIYENEEPKQFTYPAPADKGFVEAQLEFSGSFADEEHTIPKRMEFTWFVPYREGVDGMRLAAFERLIVECHMVSHEPIPDSMFTPNWTNAFATVFDFRERLTNGLPLTYITKAKTIGTSADELQERKKQTEKMNAAALFQPPETQSQPRRKLPLFLLVSTLLGLPVVIWFVFIKSKQATT